MPRNSADEASGQRSEARPRSNWPEIGINAVAAASICKSYDNKDRRRQTARKASFPFDETDFATD